MNNLKSQIRDMEDVLSFFQEHQWPFNRFDYLIKEIKRLKILDAEVEAETRIETLKLIKSN